MNSSRRIWLVKGTVISLAALVLSRALGLAKVVVVARLLGPSQFGMYTVIVSFVFSVIVFSSFGLPKASAKFIAQHGKSREEQGRILGSVLIISITLATLVGLGVAVSAGGLARAIYREPAIGRPLAIAGLAIVGLTLFEVGLSVLQGLKKFRPRAVSLTLEGVLGLTFVVVFASIWGLEGAVAGWLLTSAVIAAFVFSQTWRELRKRRIRLRWPGVGVLSRVGRFSVGALLAGIVVLPVILYGDTLLAVNGGFEEVGWMGIARSFGQIVLFIPAALVIPLTTLVAGDSMEDTRENFPEILRTNWLVVMWVALIIGASSRWAVTALYGEGFGPAATVVSRYSAVAFLMAIVSVFSAILVGTGRIWSAFLLNCVWGISFVVLATLLVPQYGVSGLLGSYFVSYTIFVTVVMIYSRLHLGLRIEIPPRLVLTTLLLMAAGLSLANIEDSFHYALGFLALGITGLVATWFLLPSKVRVSLQRWFRSLPNPTLGRRTHE